MSSFEVIRRDWRLAVTEDVADWGLGSFRSLGLL
mgnify:CR=1 FL=1